MTGPLTTDQRWVSPRGGGTPDVAAVMARQVDHCLIGKSENCNALKPGSLVMSQCKTAHLVSRDNRLNPVQKITLRLCVQVANEVHFLFRLGSS